MKTFFVAVLAFFCLDSAWATDYEICSWCSATQDYSSFAEAKFSPRPTGTYNMLIGNPYTGILKEATGYVEQDPGGPLVAVQIQSASQQLQDDFSYIASVATEEGLVVIPPNACTHCGSFIESQGEPDFYGYLFSVYADQIMQELSSKNSFLTYLVKSYFFGIHHEFVVVFPNGDSVKVAVVSLVATPGGLATVSGTAVDSSGTPLDGGSGGDQYGGGGGGQFVIRLSGPSVTTEYLCTSSNIEGSSVECRPL